MEMAMGRLWARRLRGMRAMGWVVGLRSEGGEEDMVCLLLFLR